MNRVLEDGEKIVVLDRERRLRMDFNALARAEEVTGKSFLDAETWKNLKASDYRAIAWACLLDEDPSLTIEQVGRLMTTGKRDNSLSQALLELYISDGSTPVDDKATSSLPKENAGEGGSPSPG
jgi:hypothetical protein